MNRTWGSIEEQVKEAQRANLNAHSSQGHGQEPSYWMECECKNPDNEDKYDDIEDLEDAWLVRNCNFTDLDSMRRSPIQSPEWQLYYKNWKRALVSIPLVAEYYREKEAYDEAHSFDVCLNSPTGLYFCPECQENGYEDSAFGVETGPCTRQENAREAYTEFWDLFSEDWLDYRKNKYGTS
jgi:hypothetical protein